MLAYCPRRSTAHGVHGLASAPGPERRRTGGGLEMAGYRSVGQAQCPPADRQVPPAMRVCAVRVKGRFVAHTRACLPGVYTYPVISAQKVHLTSKPVALIEDLLAITSPQSSVLDPFMGGGSVGEACIKTGRSYVGMELSREYYAISRNRLTASLAEKT